MRPVLHLALVLTLLAASPAPGAAQSRLLDESARALPTINVLRAQYGRAGLRVNDRLGRAAARHASDMVRTGRFSHRGSDGSTVIGRVRAEGYRFCWVSENLGKGYTSLTQALAGWMESPPHRRNLLSRQVIDYGLVSGPDGIWVIVMGRPGC